MCSINMNDCIFIPISFVGRNPIYIIVTYTGGGGYQFYLLKYLRQSAKWRVWR